MKARILHTKIWEDEFFSNLTTAEKLLFVYLLTNESVDIIDIYEITTRQIMFDTGLSDETIRTAKNKFSEAGKVLFNGNYVLLRNATRYQSFTGASNEVAKTKSFGNLPSEIQGWYIKIIGHPPYTLPTVTVISNKYSVISNNTKEPKKEEVWVDGLHKKKLIEVDE